LKRIVVDASVCLKWFVSEVYEKYALRLLTGSGELYAPDLIYAEIGNVLWKKWKRGEIETEDIYALIGDFKAANLIIYGADRLMNMAWDIAERYGRSFYDSLYLALAVKQECRVVTADHKLFNALKTTSLKKHILWIEEIPS
jgi:predicted nucleic acid-binding protein